MPTELFNHTCPHLSSHLVVQQLQGSYPVIQVFGLLGLLPLYDLSACFYHRLHLTFDLAQHLVKLLLDPNA